MRVGWATLVVTIVASATCVAQSIDEAVCPDTTIAGQISHGERFESTFAAGLRFVLDPSIGPPNPDGWTIRVVGKHPDHDFLMIATPPYRFNNPRYLDTSYGNTAEQAVAWSERSFSFVLTEEDYERMNEAIGVLLWPANHDSLEIEQAERVTETVDMGRGLLRIINCETTPPSDDLPMGRIERLVFQAEFCLGR